MEGARVGRGQRFVSMGAALLAAALVEGVVAHAGPRTSVDAARRGNRAEAVGSDAARLVTGSADHLQLVVAGTPPTAIMEIVPVAAKVGAYPAGAAIVGNELLSPAAGFRAWFEFRVSNWDPNGDNDPPLYYWQFKVDSSGFEGANADPPNPGADIIQAVVPCTDDSPCVTEFGEAWAKCEPFFGACPAAFLDMAGTGRTDSYCADTGSGPCEAADCDAFNPTGPRCFSISAFGIGRPDAGIAYYGATLVLDIPPSAHGTYSIDLNTDETFMGGTGTLPDDIPTFAEAGFRVSIINTGQCCFGLGTPDAGCIDGVTTEECDEELSPSVFTLFEHCPPDGPDCNRHLGACCDTLEGECEDDVVQAACAGSHRLWTREIPCTAAQCTADTGACCNHDAFGGDCQEDVPLSECSCKRCEWAKLGQCADLDCAHDAIPTVSEWGLVILTLLLLTAAKVYFRRRFPEPSRQASQGVPS